jgi:predicted phage-related endonuclease
MAITKEQRQARSRGLFATDIAQIMLGNSVEVALKKLNPPEETDAEDPVEMEAGQKVEGLILDAYERQVGCPLLERSPDTIMHPGYEWLGAHPDAFLSPRKLVEVKSVGEYIRHLWGNPGTDEIPDYVMWQVQCQMSVTDTQAVDIPVCIMNAEALKYLLCGRIPPIYIYHVERDYECENMILQKGKYVWDCIQEGQLPKPEKPSDVRLIYRRDTGAIVEADHDTFLAYLALIEIRRSIKEFEKVEEQWRFEIENYMKDAAELRYEGRTLVTWKTAKDSEKFDVKAFGAEHASLYKKFLKTVDGSRRFLPKEQKQ